ncbi:MAG: pilus assembly protein [Elusimicrobiota bacterium]|jgi:hypothetical protein|nr:pilus assembly protein [Elusimicrobiota bacterium]
MLYSNRFKNNKGQSLTEAALIMPLIVFFLFTIMWFAKIMLTWQQIVSAARYGTDLIAYTPFSENYIKQDIINYLCSELNVGRILNKDRLEVKVKIYDIDKIDYTFSLSNISSFNPLSILKDIQSLMPAGQDKSFVEIIYSHEAPFVLKALGKKQIKIKAYCEVLSSTGSPGEKKREK